MISTFYYPYDADKGGAFVYVRTLANAFKKRGHEVFIITSGEYKGLESLKPKIRVVDGIRVYYFYPATPSIPYYKRMYFIIFSFLLNFWNPHTYFVVKKILEYEKPNVVNIHEVSYLSLSVYSAAKSLNIPIVSIIHSVSLLFPFYNLPHFDKIAGIKYFLIGDNYKLYEIISTIYRKINKLIINFASPSLVVFPTKAIKKIYLKYNLFKNSKNIVFPYIIEVDVNTNLKNDEKIAKKTFDIMYCGGFQRRKGGQTLIKAFRKIENPNIRLHIFGGGKKNVEEYFKKLAAGDERIIFYGSVQNDELQNFYKIADIVVVPSEYFENFSVAIMESFRAKVPVIASNVGGTPELIKEGYNGFLFEPGNIEQLKNILENAITNKELLIEMGKNAFKLISKLDSTLIIVELEKIYKKIKKEVVK